MQWMSGGGPAKRFGSFAAMFGAAEITCFFLQSIRALRRVRNLFLPPACQGPAPRNTTLLMATMVFSTSSDENGSRPVRI